MSTTRSTDMGEYTLVEVGEPTVTNPTVWYSQDVVWKAGTAQGNAATIRQNALNALAANRTYTALAAPSTAQNTAQIKALSQQMNSVIRLLLGQLDATN